MFFTPFRWMKRKYTNLKNRWADEWINYSVHSFDSTIESIGGVSAVGFIFTLILGVIVVGINAINPIPIGVVTMQAFYMCFGIPNAGLLFSLVGVTKYLERFKRRNGYDAVFWNERKAEKWLHFFTRATLWCAIFYVVLGAVIALGTFGSGLFVPAFFVNVVALKLLILDLFWIPTCIMMPTLSWTMLTFTKFKFYLRREDFIRVEERRERTTGSRSMPEYADEDDIWDCKLERLGL